MERLGKDNALLLIVDMQERLMPVISEGQELLRRTEMLLAFFAGMGMPVLVTEQYPRGLGRTVSELQPHAGSWRLLEKMSFSCCGEPAFNAALQEFGRRNVLIAGVEAHVCIQQTALDLLDGGFHPVLLADAVSSRSRLDREIALQRMSMAGIRPATVESATFEIIRAAGTPEFRLYRSLLDSRGD